MQSASEFACRHKLLRFEVAPVPAGHCVPLFLHYAPPSLASYTAALYVPCWGNWAAVATWPTRELEPLERRGHPAFFWGDRATRYEP